MLRIKKQIKQPDGTILEIEGTEAEIEAYEKKQNKKNESAQKKKEILHGKKAKKLDMEELKRFLSEEIQKLAAIREVHHWYFNNGWWWRPWYFNGQTTYIYSQTQPASGYVGDISNFYTTTNAADLSKNIGLNTNEITNKQLAATTYTSATSGLLGNWYSTGIATNNLSVSSGGQSSAAYVVNCNGLTDADVNSIVGSYTVQ